VKQAESSFAHIRWLQERFPEAAYEDVTGLRKLATPAEVAEQEWSLNPGRYVGVVIEEDGKTEEEFAAELIAMNEEFETLNDDCRKLAVVISKNVKALAGDNE
jgi:type I restriction enzyme M protein